MWRVHSSGIVLRCRLFAVHYLFSVDVTYSLLGWKRELSRVLPLVSYNTLLEEPVTEGGLQHQYNYIVGRNLEISAEIGASACCRHDEVLKRPGPTTRACSALYPIDP